MRITQARPNMIVYKPVNRCSQPSVNIRNSQPQDVSFKGGNDGRNFLIGTAAIFSLFVITNLPYSGTNKNDPTAQVQQIASPEDQKIVDRIANSIKKSEQKGINIKQLVEDNVANYNKKTGTKYPLDNELVYAVGDNRSGLTGKNIMGIANINAKGINLSDANSNIKKGTTLLGDALYNSKGDIEKALQSYLADKNIAQSIHTVYKAIKGRI